VTTHATPATVSSHNGHVPALPIGTPELIRSGLDLALVWPAAVRFVLKTIREGRDGVRGELAVFHGPRRLSWGSHPLSSISARESLRRKLEYVSPGLPWATYLEDACWRFTQAVREGEPLVTLTGIPASPTRELIPNLLYEGDTTSLFGDGDNCKSLTALAICVAVHAGVALPFGLRPARAVPAAYLDWETSRDTHEERVGQLAAGLGIEVPPIVYKHMSRPLVDQAATLAAEFADRGIGLVVVDSMMFAVGGSDGAMVHEPITQFSAALRLFGKAAILVLNHITGEDARSGRKARPYGGVFAFNGPRLIWEAKRDQNISDGAAIVFTCRKANNVRLGRPDPFGLLFKPGNGVTTVFPFNVTEAAPETTDGASLAARICIALGSEDLGLGELTEGLRANRESVRKTLQRLRKDGRVALQDDVYRLVAR
jgi:hypothetical protein